MRRRWIQRGMRLLILALGAPLIAAAAFNAAVAFWPYPPELDVPLRASTFVLDRDGQPLAALVAMDDQWRMPLTEDRISPHLLAAIVAVEDARFFQHDGVNWRAVAAAAWQNIRAMSIRRGASTITMQVHQLRRPARRSLAYKVEQAIRAVQIERRHGKREILVEYLNRAPMGGNLVGVGAASWRYFNRDCRDLTVAQAALLAGLPKNPNAYRPDRFPERARARRDFVLGRMLALGYITAEQHQVAMAEPVDAAWYALPHVREAPELHADGALPALLDLAERFPGQTIRTTLDTALQRQAVALALSHLHSLRPSGVDALALVVLDTSTGQCLATVSISSRASRLDLSRRARSTGSVLKPFIYAAAFDAGIATPATILLDSPTAWPGYVPANFDHSFRGSISAAAALAESRNIPALLLLSQVGVDRSAAVMGQLGLARVARSPDRYGLSLAIGGAEASVMEVASAYAALMRIAAGVPWPPPRDPMIPPSTQSPPPVAVGPSPLLGRAAAQAMAAIRQRQRTWAMCPEAAALDVAWKTGTSSGFRDAWCAAVDEHYTVVVWLGNPAGEGARELVGQDAAAPLALRLIAALPRQSLGRPTAKASVPPVSERAQPLRLSRPSLALLFPTDGLEIIREEHLSAEQQQLALKASSPQQTLLYWFVDGTALGAWPSDQTVLWTPTPGSHVVRVCDSAGRWASARIKVR